MTANQRDTEFIFPNGLERRTARRMLEIADALEAGGVEVVSMIDASLYDLSEPPRCSACGCELEAGHCYCCRPVGGYGTRFAETRHGASS